MGDNDKIDLDGRAFSKPTAVSELRGTSGMYSRPVTYAVAASLTTIESQNKGSYIHRIVKIISGFSLCIVSLAISVVNLRPLFRVRNINLLL